MFHLNNKKNNNRKIAICRKKYITNVKNAITKSSSKLNQSEYSDRELRANKAQPWAKSLTNAIVTIVFRSYDVTLTIS